MSISCIMAAGRRFPMHVYLFWKNYKVIKNKVGTVPQAFQNCRKTQNGTNEGKSRATKGEGKSRPAYLVWLPFLRLSTILKTSIKVYLFFFLFISTLFSLGLITYEVMSKFVWSNAFWYVKVCISWKCIRYTIHWDKV